MTLIIHWPTHMGRLHCAGLHVDVNIIVMKIRLKYISNRFDLVGGEAISLTGLCVESQ